MLSAIHQYICTQIQAILGVTEAHGVVAIAYLVLIGIVFAIAVGVYIATRLLVVPLVQRSFKHTKSIYLHVIAKNKTMDALSHFISASVFYVGIQFIKEQSGADFAYLQQIAHILAVLYIFLSLMFIISYMIWSLNQYYIKKFHFSNQYPIYSYLKVAIVIAWLIWGILIAAYFANTSPLALLTGLGAVSAIFLLLFRDSLLGIVASIQVTASNIVRIGDRIILDKYSIDGEVIDIAITTVKVQNSDNTIATIPTYSLISEVVRNWRGVIDIGGRRIKRSLHLDIDSIGVCDPELLKKLSEVQVLRDYIDTHTGEEIINLALYRIYLVDYLTKHPGINNKLVTVVRHLESGVTGLPVEIYAFSNDTSFAGYEAIQADIFEHCFAALGRFNLKILQYPTA